MSKHARTQGSGRANHALIRAHWAQPDTWTKPIENFLWSRKHLQLRASRQTPRPPLRPVRQRQPRRQHRKSPRAARRRAACRRPATAAGCHTERAARAALPMPTLRRPHDRHRGVRTRLRAEVAADAGQVRHVMSQTSSARRPLSRSVALAPRRRRSLSTRFMAIHAPAPVHNPSNPARDASFALAPPPRAGMQVAPPQSPASIECAANLKSP